MEFAVTFNPGVSAEIVSATQSLYAGIDGVHPVQLSLSSKSATALLVKLSPRVIQTTHKHFVGQHVEAYASYVSAISNEAADSVDARSGQATAAQKLPNSGDLLGGDNGITPAEAVLLGISFLEAVQASSPVVQLLYKHGHLKQQTAAAAAAAADHTATDAKPETETSKPLAAAAAKTADSSSTSIAHGSSSSSSSIANSPLSSVTASPASGLPIYPAADTVYDPATAAAPAAGAAAAGAAVDPGAAQTAVNVDVVDGVTALLGSSGISSTRAAGALQQQQQSLPEESDFLIPLLRRCGVIDDVVPLHDANAIAKLKQRTWSSFLAPADEFRWYFGNHIGFYLSFLNAMTLWLLAPAAVSIYLALAVRFSSSSSSSKDNAAAAVVSSPLVPFLLVFHLLWSAAGLRLWKRQESGLNHKWYHGSSSSSTGSSSTELERLQKVKAQADRGRPAAAAESDRPIAAAAAPAGPAESAPAAAAAAAAGANVIGRLPGDESSHATAAAALGSGVTAASLVTPAAAGIRREYTGTWTTNPITRQAELVNPIHNQLLRYSASIAATLLLLLAAAAVLLVCLNVQGYIPPHHTAVYWFKLARLSTPGHVFAADQGLIMSQVPLMLRVGATVLYTSLIYGPAAKWLTAFENHRTVEGYAASLTVKQASLYALFTFTPVAYVGLIGAGATAARAEVAGFFRIELLRRIAVEFLLPWLMYWLSARKVQRQSNLVNGRSKAVKPQSNLVKDAAGAVNALVQEIRPESGSENNTNDGYNIENDNIRGTAASSTTAGFVAEKLADVTATQGSSSDSSSSSSIVRDVGVVTDVTDALSDCLKPAYDIFTDCWELNRDLGYLLLFAAVYPPAAVFCLIYNLVKVKQDCLKLLVVYRRPVPAQLRGIGSWKTVLTVQVFAAVITNIFLSGLSTGQLAQLLPAPLVPESTRSALLAAAAARPGVSTAASQIPHDLSYARVPTTAGNPAGPMLSVLQDISTGVAGGSIEIGNEIAARSGAFGGYDKTTAAFEAAKMCPNNGSAAFAFGPRFARSGDLSDLGCSSSSSSGYCPLNQSLAGCGPLQMPRSGQCTMSGNAPTAGTAAADHLLLLFLLEHLLVLAMLLIMWLIPAEPPVVRDAARQQQLITAKLLQQQHGLGSSSGSGQKFAAEPRKVHANPLYMETAARPSAAAVGSSI